MPGHSPGARIHDGVGTSSRASRCVVRRFAPAYIIRVGDRRLLGELDAAVEVCSTTSCAIAVSRPSRVGAEPQPLDRRRAVAGEGEHLLPRDARPSPGARRPAPPSPPGSTCGRGVPFEPKPPPTCGAITRTLLRLEPERLRDGRRAPAPAPWFESWSVSPPPSHVAIVACGSIGLLWNAGVGRCGRSSPRRPRRRRRSRRRSVSVAKPGLTVLGLVEAGVVRRAARRRAAPRRTSKRTSRAAWRAVSMLSATTSADDLAAVGDRRRPAAPRARRRRPRPGAARSRA